MGHRRLHQTHTLYVIDFNYSRVNTHRNLSTKTCCLQGNVKIPSQINFEMYFVSTVKLISIFSNRYIMSYISEKADNTKHT